MMEENEFSCAKNGCKLIRKQDCYTCGFFPAEAERRNAIIRRELTKHNRKSKNPYQLIINGSDSDG